jgi:N-dimethylarginine dimethylaminohydrolase
MSSEVAPLSEVVVKHPREAFVGPDEIAREWRALNFASAPDFARAIDEYDQFLNILGQSGASVRGLPRGAQVGLDAIYTRDASVVAPAGMVLCRMGKALRSGEPAAHGEAFRAWGIPVAGAIEAPGRLEGGDVIWLSTRVVAVGHGYRTNDSGIAQLGNLLGPDVELVVVPLPHWRGPEDVFHLMSVISTVDEDLALVYSPLLPVPFRQRLAELGYQLVEVPDEEFGSMGANVLAIAPRRVVMLDGNPRTRARLERARAEVLVYPGAEISLKGGGGPTCLTRPVRRGHGDSRTWTSGAC